MSGTVQLVAGQESTFEIRLNLVPVSAPTLTIYSDEAETIVAVPVAVTAATASPSKFTGLVPASLGVGDYYLGIGITTGFGTTTDMTCRLQLKAVAADVSGSDDAVLAHQIRPSEQAATQRVLRGQAARVRHLFVDEETPFDLDAAPTVTVTDAEGNSVASLTSTRLDQIGSGHYEAMLPPQDELAALTLTWSGLVGGVPITMTDRVDVAGAQLFTLKQAREHDEALSSTAKFPTARLAELRLAVEDEADYICGRALVPRYARVKVDGTGTRDLRLPYWNPRVVRRVTVYTSATASEDFDTETLASIALFEDGLARLPVGLVWPEGTKNLVVVFEHGWDGPPADLVEAALQRLRNRATSKTAPAMDRATSYTSDAGGTYRLDQAGEFKTGMPEVDAVYARSSRRVSSAGGSSDGERRPAFGQLTFVPQAGGLFHGQRSSQ